MYKYLFVATAIVPLLTGFAHAQSQPFKPIGPQQTWTLDVGGGAVYGFSPDGGDPEKINAIPWVSFSYKDRLSGDPISGLSYNLIARDRLISGVQVRPHFGGKSGGLEGLDVPGLGADLSAYAFYRIGENFSVGGRVMRDITNVSKGSSLFLSAAHQDVTPVGMLQMTVYSRFGDRRSNQAYYGVENSEAAATGLSPYEVGAGPQGVGIAILLATPIHEKWVVASFLNAECALGDVAKSPLLQLTINKEMSYRAGLMIVRRFGGT